MYWRRGAKTGVVGSKSRIYPRFQNLSFCDVTRVGMISNHPHLCVFKNATFYGHESFKNSSSGSCKENYIRDPVGSIEKLIVRGVCVLNLYLVYTVQCTLYSRVGQFCTFLNFMQSHVVCCSPRGTTIF